MERNLRERLWEGENRWRYDPEKSKNVSVVVGGNIVKYLVSQCYN